MRTRAKYIPFIGALARREGCRNPTGVSRSFAARVWQAGLPRRVFSQTEQLLNMLRSLGEQNKPADERAAEIVKDDEVVKRLTTVPGVGPITATTYAATLDGRLAPGTQSRCAHTFVFQVFNASQPAIPRQGFPGHYVS